MPDLVDLGAALADDRTDHVIGDVDLLGQWLAGESSGHGLTWLRRMGLDWLRSAVGSRLMGASASVAARRLVVKRLRGVWVCDLAWHTATIRHTVPGVGGGSSTVLLGMVSLKALGMAVLPASSLGDIRYDLHAARDNASWASTASSIGRGSWATKPLSQLFNQSDRNVVGCNVHSVSNTKDNKRSFGGQGQAGIRGIQPGTGSLLNFADADARLANDGANEDVGDEEAERIGLRLSSRGRIQRFVVESPDDQSKSLCTYMSVDASWGSMENTHLCNSILQAAHGQDPLNSPTGIIANGALCAGQPSDLRDILATLSNTGRRLSARNDRTDMNPVGLVLLPVLRRGLGRRTLVVRGRGLDGLRLQDSSSGLLIVIGGSIRDNQITLTILHTILVDWADASSFNLDISGLFLFFHELGVILALYDLVQSGTFGVRLVVGTRRGGRVLERTLSRSVGRSWRSRHFSVSFRFVFISIEVISGLVLAPSWRERSRRQSISFFL